MSVSVTWHGHGTYSLNINGTNIVVDPFFAGNNPAAKTSAEDVAAEFILQTHGHADHIADTVPLAKRTDALVIANFEIHTWINNQGHAKTHPLNTGGGFDFPFGRAKMTPALHSSGLPDGTYGGDPGGFVVWAGGKTIYFAGDTAVFSDMSLIGNLGLDLAVLPIGDNFTMGPDDALLALDFLKPKTVLPGHYNTWPLIAVDVNVWAEKVKATTAVQPILVDVDEPFTL